MKPAIIKTHRHVSHLGDAVFKNVPVLVDDSFSRKEVNSKTDEYAISGDVVMRMEREVAKTWLTEKADPRNLKADEVNAVRILCGLNQSEFASVLGLTKGTMSKVLKSRLKLRSPMSDLCLLVLAAEIANPGAARAILNDSLTSIAGKLPRPQFDLKKLA